MALFKIHFVFVYDLCSGLLWGGFEIFEIYLELVYDLSRVGVYSGLV